MLILLILRILQKGNQGTERLSNSHKANLLRLSNLHKARKQQGIQTWVV